MVRQEVYTRPINPCEANPINSTDLQDQLWAHPARVYLRDSNRAGIWIDEKIEGTLKTTLDLTNAITQDIKNNKISPIVPTASLCILGLSQYFDRTRAFLEHTGPRAVETMVDMNFSPPSSVVAAGIVTAGFMAWNTFAGEIVNRTISIFPKTKDAFVERLPRVTKAAEYAIPASLQQYNITRAEHDHTPELGLRTDAVDNRPFTRLKRGIKRGINGISFGSTIYMGVSSINGIPTNERTKINTEVSRDTGIFAVFPLSYVAAEVIRQSVTQGDPETAATVLSWAQDADNWRNLGYGIMGVTVGMNYFARRKIDKQSQAENHEKLNS